MYHSVNSVQFTRVFAEMQRDHQRREHRLQEAHCCALSTMEEARQHQIRVGNTSVMHACGCVLFSLIFDMFAEVAVCVSGCTAVQNIIHTEEVSKSCVPFCIPSDTHCIVCHNCSLPLLSRGGRRQKKIV